MAVKTKSQLAAEIAALGSTYSEAAVEALLTDMVDSYNNLIAQVTTAGRNALTPTTGLVVYNTDTNRQEYWNGTAWFAIGQNISTPQTVKVALTSVQLLALDATAIQVVAAPGAGYAIVVQSCAYKFTYGTTQYSGGSVVLKSAGANTSNPFLQIASQIIQAAADRSGSLPGNTGTGIHAIYENSALELKANSAISAGDGTLTVWVTYSVIEI